MIASVAEKARTFDNAASRMVHRHAGIAAHCLIALAFIAISAVLAGYVFGGRRFTVSLAAALVCLLAGDLIIGRYLRQFSRQWVRSTKAVLIFVSAGLCIGHVLLAWHHGDDDYLAYANLVPTSDAACYYRGACSMKERGVLNDESSRRPLGVMLFGLFLKATGGNLQTALMLNTIMVGIGIACASVTMARFFGATAGFVMSIGLFLFIKSFLAVVFTEPAGFFLGCLGFSLVIEAIKEKRPLLFIFGTFMLSFGMSVRMGPLFVLPGVVIAGAMACRSPKMGAWAVGAAAGAVAVLGLLGSPLVTRCVAPASTSIYNGNLFEYLYAMSRGGDSWTDVYSDHPELLGAGVTEAERFTRMRHMTLLQLRQNPGVALAAVAREIRYAARYPSTFFPFLRDVFSGWALLISIIACAAWLLFPTPRGTGLGLLTIACATGIILSVPFMLDAGIRVCAVAIPFMVMIFALAAGSFTGCLTGSDIPAGNARPRIVPILAATAVAAVLAAPFILKWTAPLGPARPVPANSSADMRVFRASKGTFVHIVSDTSKAFVPDVRIGVVKNNWSWMKDRIDQLREGDYFGAVYDLSERQQDLYLILREDPARFDGKLVQVHVGNCEDPFAVCRAEIAGTLNNE